MPSGIMLWTGIYAAVTVLILSFFPAYAPFSSFTWTFISVSILSTIARLIYLIVLYPIFFTPFKNIPMPPGRSLLTGHFAQLKKEPAGFCSRRWTQEIPNNGLIRYYFFTNFERLLVTTPKIFSEILVSKSYDFEKPTEVKASLEQVLGNGILIAEGDVHRRQRRILNPAFSFRHVKDLYPIFWNKGAEMVNAIENSIKSQPSNVIQISSWASRTTLDIIGIAGMDHDFNAINDPNNRLNMEYKKMFSDPTGTAMLLRFLSFTVDSRLGTLIPTKRNREVDEGAAYVRSICQQMIDAKRAKMTKGESRSVDILSVALESGGFSDAELINQMMTFLAAGHETTATALQWTAYALCKHPTIQSRLRDEIRSALPPLTATTTETPTISASLIDSLPYLNAVCSEVLRFYAPVPMTVRAAVRDTTLDGTFIPKGTVLTISPAATNHNPELWGADAGTFDPERWMGAGKAKQGGAENNYAFMTFLHGPRSCIGSAFSRGELACLVACLVGKFEMELLEPEKELDIKSGVTAPPRDGVVAKVRVVEGW
ncbi:hypothetical protein FQN55_001505 [Onygenales sp. PD_40]|nr:hypothetical protein FQN55_001505 [Onygenales sp. PD_40]KAK2796540.1 hypothetical protein FQN51_009320 [Onygenales sp. PD_10]